MTRVMIYGSSSKDIKSEVETIDFVFKYNHVIYRICCMDINYIEKESSVKRCVINTTGGKYFIVDSLNHLMSNISGNFFRIHQSCIVNINNIREVDLINNIITFENGDKTSLVSDKMKKQLVNVLGLSNSFI